MLGLIADVGRCAFLRAAMFVLLGFSLSRYRSYQEGIRRAAEWVGIILGPWREDERHMRRVDQVAGQVLSGSFQWN